MPSRVPPPKPPIERKPLHPFTCDDCPSIANCVAMRRCFVRTMEQIAREPHYYRVTRADLNARAFGWALLGFAAGWIFAGLPS